MLLRLRGPDGMIRLTVESDTSFKDMGVEVSLKLPIRRASGLYLADRTEPIAAVASPEDSRPKLHHVIQLAHRRRCEAPD